MSNTKEITLRQAVSAAGALASISAFRLPLEKSFKIFTMQNNLKTRVDFCVAEERKIIEEHGGKIKTDGGIIFEGDDKETRAQECFQDLEKLHYMIIGLEVSPVELKLSDYPEISISPEDIRALVGIVDFE